MKVLLINGSPNQTGCTYTALHEVETTLQANGIETELLYLGKKPIAGCIARTLFPRRPRARDTETAG